MRHAHRFPQQLVRWISLSVCFTVVLSVLTTIPIQTANSKGLGYERRTNRATKPLPQLRKGAVSLLRATAKK